MAKTRLAPRPAFALHAAAQALSEKEALSLMQRARDCADSETCSIDDANFFLENVLSLQSNCADGTLTADAVCGDADNVSEIVVGLRSKVEDATAPDVMNMGKAASQGEGKFSLIPLYIGMAGLYVAVTSILLQSSPDAVAPFTAQEWWWATRDGYLGAMISAYVKSGGLAATNDDTLLNTLNVVPFTAQEWWWAMRDGYLNNMVTAYLKTGGLVMENDMVNAMPTSSVVPFTPQEWWWAMKDGYLGSMLSEQFQAGGCKGDDMDIHGTGRKS